MEPGWLPHHQATRFLVRFWDDSIVRTPFKDNSDSANFVRQRSHTVVHYSRSQSRRRDCELFYSVLASVANQDGQPSPKVAVIRFERGMQQGLLARISRTSIMEYHAFGIISYVAGSGSPDVDRSPHIRYRSEGVHSKEHYLICGVQGDFTRSLVENPPTHLWTRQLKVRSHLLGSVGCVLNISTVRRSLQHLNTL